MFCLFISFLFLFLYSSCLSWRSFFFSFLDSNHGLHIMTSYSVFPVLFAFHVQSSSVLNLTEEVCLCWPSSLCLSSCISFRWRTFPSKRLFVQTKSAVKVKRRTCEARRARQVLFRKRRIESRIRDALGIPKILRENRDTQKFKLDKNWIRETNSMQVFLKCPAWQRIAIQCSCKEEKKMKCDRMHMQSFLCETFFDCVFDLTLDVTCFSCQDSFRDSDTIWWLCLTPSHNFTLANLCQSDWFFSCHQRYKRKSGVKSHLSQEWQTLSKFSKTGDAH